MPPGYEVCLLDTLSEKDNTDMPNRTNSQDFPSCKKRGSHTRLCENRIFRASTAVYSGIDCLLTVASMSIDLYH